MQLEVVFSESELKSLCARCGARGTDHGLKDNPHRPFACPGKTFPKYPKIKDESKASELFDKRLAKFWTERKTVFYPCT